MRSMPVLAVVVALVALPAVAGAQQERPGSVQWAQRQALLNESSAYWVDLWERAQWHYDRVGMAGMEGANASEFFDIRRQRCEDAGFEWIEVKEDVPFCRCRSGCRPTARPEPPSPALPSAPRPRQPPSRPDPPETPTAGRQSDEENGANHGPAVCSCAASRLSVGSVTSCTVAGHRLLPQWSATGSVQVSTDVQAPAASVTGIGPPGTGTVSWRPGRQCAVIDVRPAIRMEGYELPEPERTTPRPEASSGGVPGWAIGAIIGGGVATLVWVASRGGGNRPVVINPR